MKLCNDCKIFKKLDEFHKHKKSKDGYRNSCKSCRKIKLRKYYIHNKNKIKLRVNQYRKEHLQERLILKRNYRKKYAWQRVLEYIKQRCNYPKNDNYKYYGGKGIKCRITAQELKELWIRDKAYLMEKPSISRKNHDKDYILNNCKFIELSENSRESIQRNKLKRINQLRAEEV